MDSRTPRASLPVPSKIITTHVRPPIPMRSHDWSAHFDGREDGPVGWGRTKADAIADLEIERVFAMTDAEVMVEAIAELGNPEAVRTRAQELRDMMLATVDAHAAARAPTPDPAVMRDYIVRLTAFFIDNPQWVALAEEARGYVGALWAAEQTEAPEPRGDAHPNHGAP